MEERLVQEYVGKTLREFLINECEETIDNRVVWICIECIYYTVTRSDSFTQLLDLGCRIKESLIKDIKCYDDNDLTIYIENPFV